MTLPRGWTASTIEMLTELVSRGRTPSYIEASDFPVVNQRSVRWNGIDEHHLKFVDPASRQRWSPSLFLREGDILWNSTGTGTIGRAALFQRMTGFEHVVLDSHVTLVRVIHALDPQYLFALIRSPRVQGAIADMQSGSTNQVELSRSAILATEVPLPPLAEQRRIVAKLDALVIHIARARAELSSASRLAKAVRTTAVENAFSQKLRVGSANQLSGASITVQDLADEGPTNGWSPPSGADATGALTLKLTATTSGRLRLDPAAVKRIYDTPPSTSKFWLRAGDLLIQRANALDHVGATAIYEGPPKTYIYPDLMMRIRVSDPKLTRLLWYYLNSPRVRAHFRDKATGTAGNMPKISGAVVKSLTFPKLSEVERVLTLERLDAAFARADRLEAEAARAAKLLNRLEASILAKAFQGELVPQDPADEPASVLLDRIRTERAAAPQAKRGRRVVSAASS